MNTKNFFNYEWGEGVYINGSMSHKIYYDKKIKKLCYQYPGKFSGNDVYGILSNDDINDLINLLEKYKTC